MALLEVRNLNAWYDRSHVVQDISFEVQRGEIVTLMGRNGAGKTTTLRTLMGLLARSSGSIAFDGKPLQGRPAHERYHRGLAYVPEDRRIVTGLTVRENLELGLIASNRRNETDAMVDEIAATFPRLKERLAQDATSLSGGEQQMLAIARAMIRNPRIMLLDEPFEGLAPLIVRDLVNLCRRLADEGQTIVIVEQNVPAALSLAHRCYILNNGHVVYDGDPAGLRKEREIVEKYLGVKA